VTDVEVIARRYGTDEQSRQTIEEMGELIVALNKVHRHYSNENIANVIEELADVSLMVDQMIYLYDCENEVKNIKRQKVKRQLERMGMKL
jgi:NTP pyrophosphatase (non-canonical NTP hydrolase)